MEQVDTDRSEYLKVRASRAAPAGRDSAPRVLRMLRVGFQVLDKIAPGLGGRWAYWLWFRTHRFPEPRREQAYRKDAQRVPFEYAGKPLAVYTWGEGAPVLLTHGWNGRATQLWSFVDPLVKSGFRVVAFDLPAHGHSAGNRTDLFKIAESIRMIANGFGPLHGIISHSLSNAALVMAIRDGLNTNKVVCISPPSQSILMLKNYADALELSARIQKRLRTLFVQDYGAQVWKQTSIAENVGDLSVPALIIHDKDDREVPWEQGQQIAKNWPGAQLLSTESLGHRRILRNQDVVTKSVEFLRA